MEPVNWLQVAARIVRCVGYCEGTIFAAEWESFGVTREQRKLVEAEADRQDAAEAETIGARR